MEKVFLILLNRSISASWLILIIVGLRRILKGIPKSARCIFWALAGIRLLCPISVESAFSLVPSTEYLSLENLYSTTSVINSGIEAVKETVNSGYTEPFVAGEETGVGLLQLVITIFANIWVIGLIGIGIYTISSCCRLQKKVNIAIPKGERIWLCDEISSPFVMGIVKPQIYLPSTLEEKWFDYVIAHETMHIRRHDHWWKAIGFFLFAVYWFNPFVWLAYHLMCKDIELTCDEAVIKDWEMKEKKNYLAALLACSTLPHMASTYPLAFGEIGVKERIKSVLQYKKATVWEKSMVMIISLVLGICFLTNPQSNLEAKWGKQITDETGKQKEKFVTAIATYYQKEDETWYMNGVTYQYRKKLAGTIPGAEKETVFLVLTNKEKITFEEVARSTYTSNSQELLDESETRIVEMNVVEKFN